MLKSKRGGLPAGPQLVEFISFRGKIREKILHFFIGASFEEGMNFWLETFSSCRSCCLQVLGQSTGCWCPAGCGLGLRALGKCEPVPPSVPSLVGAAAAGAGVCVWRERCAPWAWGTLGGQNCMSPENSEALVPNGLVSLMGIISQLLPAWWLCCPSTPESGAAQRAAAPFWFWSRVLVSSQLHVMALGRRMPKAILSTAASNRSPTKPSSCSQPVVQRAPGPCSLWCSHLVALLLRK